MVLRAVEMAVWQRPEATQAILHSDRGTQFTSGNYQRYLKKQRLIGEHECCRSLCRYTFLHRAVS